MLLVGFLSSDQEHELNLIFRRKTVSDDCSTISLDGVRIHGRHTLECNALVGLVSCRPNEAERVGE